MGGRAEWAGRLSGQAEWAGQEMRPPIGMICQGLLAVFLTQVKLQ